MAHTKSGGIIRPELLIHALFVCRRWYTLGDLLWDYVDLRCETSNEYSEGIA
jgi:hypothetical protein